MNGERGISQIVGIGFGALFALVAFVIVYTYEPSAAGVPVETRASGDSTFEPMQTGGGSFETEKTGAESGGQLCLSLGRKSVSIRFKIAVANIAVVGMRRFPHQSITPYKY